jgi:hypothetical protein
MKEKSGPVVRKKGAARRMCGDFDDSEYAID